MEKETFRETQKIGLFWVGLTLVLCFPPASWTFVQQVILGKPVGDNPGPDWVVWLIFILIGVCLPAFIMSLRLEVEVLEDCLRVRFFPLRTRRILFGEIRSCAVRTYRPLREYGGWGIKYGRTFGWSYTLSGDRGVQLELEGGKRLLVGSHRADELAKAVEEKRAASN